MHRKRFFVDISSHQFPATCATYRCKWLRGDAGPQRSVIALHDKSVSTTYNTYNPENAQHWAVLKVLHGASASDVASRQLSSISGIHCLHECVEKRKMPEIRMRGNRSVPTIVLLMVDMQ
jgi:hypothetical protein